MGGLHAPTDAPTDRPTDAPVYHTMTGQPTSTDQQARRGTTTSVDVGEMNGLDRLLAGTSWTKDDVDLALNAVATAVLLYWAIVEVRQR
jgi:hypothetical protein